MTHDYLASLLGPWAAQLTLGASVLRVTRAVLLGAIIGCERSSKRHSAGLRTFMLVSLSTASIMIIDLCIIANTPCQVPLLSASAIIGTAMISGNSILFSSKNQIKGLTTSAGLWACGIIGLAAGAGFYTLSILLFLFLLCSISWFPVLETYLKDRSNHFEVHLELKSKTDLASFV